MLEIDWNVVRDETRKPFCLVLFAALHEYSTRADGSSDQSLCMRNADGLARLWRQVGGSECKKCKAPVDPKRKNQTYCSRYCEKDDRSNLADHKRICDNNWNCVLQLDEILSLFCHGSARGMDQLAAQLRATAKGLLDPKVRPTVSKVWYQIRTVYRFVKEEAGSSQRDELFELCCPRDADESMRKETRERLDHLHQRVINLPTLGGIIDQELRATRSRL